MKNETFRFIIEEPQDHVVGGVQFCKIVAKYPNFMYSCPLNKYKSMSRDEHIRLAIAELKVELIKAISAAEFVEERK